MNTLNLPSFGEYQSWLANHPKEWDVLDSMCRITISRFYRDWAVFDFLMDNLLHRLAKKAKYENRPFRCWSAGCASGEEPYTLALIWHFVLRKKFPALDFQIIATDIDERLLERAKKGCYPKGSLKGLPKPWLDKAFSVNEIGYCIHSSFSKSIKWIKQDIRISFPSGTFDLLLCRNLVATYFEPSLQRAIFNQMKAVLRPGGFLVLGCHEKLPDEIEGFSLKLEKLNIYEISANPIFFNAP